MLNSLTMGIAVGYPFLWGVPVLLLVFVRKGKSFSRRILVLGFLFVSLPLTTPIPILLHILWGFFLVGSLIVEQRSSRNRIWWSRLFILTTFLTWGNEIRHQIWWPLPQKQYSQLVLVGDSLTAGLGFGGEVIWPDRLRKETGWNIVDLSQPGATVKSAQKQALQIPPGEVILLLEIGGNDLLEFGNRAEFERELDRLLNIACQSGREVIMFELPLPPFYQSFGEVQRQLAVRYHARLLPKRCFGSLLSPADATVDGLHFSNSGHEQVANFVRRLLERVMKKLDE